MDLYWFIDIIWNKYLLFGDKWFIFIEYIFFFVVFIAFVVALQKGLLMVFEVYCIKDVCFVELDVDVVYMILVWLQQ